jgi:hypothetical protein
VNKEKEKDVKQKSNENDNKKNAPTIISEPKVDDAKTYLDIGKNPRGEKFTLSEVWLT